MIQTWTVKCSCDLQRVSLLLCHVLTEFSHSADQLISTLCCSPLSRQWLWLSFANHTIPYLLLLGSGGALHNKMSPRKWKPYMYVCHILVQKDCTRALRFWNVAWYLEGTPSFLHKLIFWASWEFWCASILFFDVGTYFGWYNQCISRYRLCRSGVAQ